MDRKARFVWIAFVLLFAGAQTLQASSGEDKSPMPLVLGKPAAPAMGLSTNPNDTSRGLQSLQRTGVLTGNLIRSAFGNFGNLGSRTLAEARLEWPVGSGVTYGFEFIFFVAGEVMNSRGEIIHIIDSRYTGGSRDVPTPETHQWGWYPKPGYFNTNDGNEDEVETPGVDEDLNGNGILDPGEDLNNNGLLDHNMVNDVEYPAMSHLPQTWPYDWPLGSYPGEPGVRRNKWNGEYGAYVRGDQESYYVMDDAANDEFDYYPFDGDTLSYLNGGRRGLGLDVEVRNYQWAHPLAEDIIISIYQPYNVSDKDLPKNILGMYVDADIGFEDPSDDASSFDTHDDITYQWDLEGLDKQGRKTGYFGFAFLQSPGNDHNHIDDDEDGMVDESQQDGIDNDQDWLTFDDANHNGVWDWEDKNMNGRLDPGEDLDGDGELDLEELNDDVGSDGIGPWGGPNGEPWPGPDPDGTEGNGQPDLGEPHFEYTDNDEIDQIGLTSFYGDGVGGQGIRDDEGFWRGKIQPGFFNEATAGMDVGFTYGCGFFKLDKGQFEHFAISALCGSDFGDIIRNKRTMQVIYNNDYSFTKPPRKPILTAIPGDRKVTLIWDDAAERTRDPVYGWDFEGYKIYRATDPHFNEVKVIDDAYGNPVLWKPLVTFDKKDGLKGLHPIPLGETGVHYDMGTDSGLRHSYVDTSVQNGRTYYYAVVSYDMGYALDFPERGLIPTEGLEPIPPSESSKVIETDLLGNVVNVDINCAVVTPEEPAAGYVPPSLADSVEHVAGPGTGSISVDILRPDLVVDHTYQISFRDTLLNHVTAGFTFEDLTTGQVLFRSTAMDNLETPEYDDPNLEKQLFDGFKLRIHNDQFGRVVHSEWRNGASNLVITVVPKELPMPIDFEIVWADTIVDRTFSPAPGNRFPIKFFVRNLTDSTKMQVELSRIAMPIDQLGPGDGFYIIGKRLGRKRWFAYEVFVDAPEGQGVETIMPEPGTAYYVETSKPFGRNDVFKFSMKPETKFDAEVAKTRMDDIYVVPDPYVAVNSLEPKQPSSLRGRGERRIDFVNLPPHCTIRIFTQSGRLIRVLHHDSVDNQGRESWDLLTRDGLEVSYGIYFYHVEAPGVGEKLGKFAIIK